MRTVTAKQIAYALDISEDTVLRREGTTIPAPVNPQAKPHLYELRKVLYLVNGKERELICAKLSVKVNIVISEHDNPNEGAGGFVPRGAFASEWD